MSVSTMNAAPTIPAATIARCLSVGRSNQYGSYRTRHPCRRCGRYPGRSPVRAFLQYGIHAIALIARKAFKMLLQGFAHNDDDGSRSDGPPMPACRERDRKDNTSRRRQLLGDSVLMEGVQLLIDGLQRFTMVDAEDDDGVATVLAIQLVAAAHLQ